MRILIVDSYGECALAWAMRCQQAGHTVKWFFPQTPRNEDIGKGLVERVSDWRDWMRWADLVFLPDNTRYLRELDAWRERGARIVGPNVAGAAWELDRDEGMRVLKRAGIETPPSRKFSSYRDAIRFIERDQRRFVCKPCGVEGDKSLSYCPKSAEDMIYQLERWEKLGKVKGEFILQEFIPGTEVAVGGWFGPGGFNAAWEENIEHKKLFPGEIGPNTGEMGTWMRFVKKSKLANKLLKPLEEQLDRIGYVGCVDVNVIADEKGRLWPLEFTMRPGWPAFNIQQALTDGDPAEWLSDLLDGRDTQPMVWNTNAIGVVLGLPDMPYDHRPISEALGIPIYGLTPARMKNVFPCMVQAGEAPQQIGDKIVRAPCLVSAGTYVLVATGTGDTVRDARRRVYGLLDKIDMPGSPFYRNDIGVKLKKSLPALQAHGYLEGVEY